MSEQVVHRMQCAAVVNGCLSVLVWEDRNASENLRAEDLRRLELNGWRLDHGKWVCGAHG
jgi:hypothetical protein